MLDEREVRNLLSKFCVADAPVDAMMGYLNTSLKRLIYTMDLIPIQEGEALELGANPYYLSLLLLRHTKLHMRFANYFGSTFGAGGIQEVKEINGAGVIPLAFSHFNIENETPYDKEFDLVFFCEILEHMTNDPMAALLNVKKSIKPNGYMILTTPNAVRHENVVKVLNGKNFYDPYSANGSYGRHNREYTVEELKELLGELGFEIEKIFTRDVHPYYGENIDIDERSSYKNHGQYIFILAKNATQKEQYVRPDWLYSSYVDKVIK